MSNRKKYFLVGAMTGLPGDCLNPIINTLRGYGLDIVNPADNKLQKNITYYGFIKAGIKLMMDCDAIILLPGWEKFYNTQLAHDLAVKLKMDIIKSDDFLNYLDKQAERL